MKIRLSFVSNSSSSSYVIAVARITNKEEFENLYKNSGIDYELYTTKEALNTEPSWHCPVYRNKREDKVYFKEEAFDGNEAMIEIDPAKDELFVRLSDNRDIEEDDEGAIEPADYDSKIFELEGKDFVEKFNFACGYGRNG